MPPRPVVTKISAIESLRINIHLENIGDALLNSGHLFGRKIFKDGSVSDLMSFAYTTLAPGEATKLFVNSLSNCKSVEIEGYKETNAETYPMKHTMARGLFGWKLK